MRFAPLLASIILAALAAPTSAAQDAPPADPAPPPAEAVEPLTAETLDALDVDDPTGILLRQIEQLLEEMRLLRQEVAQARMDADQARREADELRQFIADHHEYGSDFERYREVRKFAEEEARRRALEQARERRERERAERLARYQDARARRAEEQAEQDRIARYHRAGFKNSGLGVFIGRTAYAYAVRDETNSFVDYDPFLGLYYRPGVETRIDYSKMTISGSVLNASDEVRNIGVAVAFFDDAGNQVGAETIQISNARPNVPYPFTSTLEMALNRPFSSSSSYVLYADPAESE